MLARSLGHTQRWHWTTVGVVALALAGAVSCGQQNTTGRSPSYLVIDSLKGASGAKPDTFASVVESDVLTNATIFEDMGQVSLRMALKDIGLTSPTTANSITVTRYHVEFKRADGRNTPGVDVPYGFDGAATGTFDTSGGVLTFVLVRVQAKLEAPLKALRNGGSAIVISTIADITFYGADQNGNQVSVAGSISVNFADWGDPT